MGPFSVPDIQRWLYEHIAAGMGEASGVAPMIGVLAIALLFGSLHALMPGHGKSVLVSYHLGTKTRMLEGWLNGSLLVLVHVGSAVVLVLAGITVIRASLGRSRETAALEIASAALIGAIGVWLLWRALRPHRHERLSSGRVLALATGLVPCPLTTFIMTYAVVNENVVLGLIVVLAMAIGMVATIGGFAAAAALARERFAAFLERSRSTRLRVGQALEILGALGIIAIGMWPLAARLLG
jgi:nickel/cobalt transporter (NicO) family protein